MKRDQALTGADLLFRLEIYGKQRWFDSRVQAAIKETRSVEVLLTLVDVENLEQVAVVLFALFCIGISKFTTAHATCVRPSGLLRFSFVIQASKRSTEYSPTDTCAYAWLSSK